VTAVPLNGALESPAAIGDRARRRHEPPPAVNRLIPRRRLIDAIAIEKPRLVTAFASAGYGKSVLAAQVAAEVPSVFCDCSDVHDAAGLYDLLLGNGHPGPTDPNPTPATIVDTLVTSWYRAAERIEAVVLDNVDTLPPSAYSLLAQLIDETPEMTIMLCGRRPQKTPFAMRLRPTDILTLSERDLAFDTAETRDLFEGRLSESTLAGVERIGRGWPMALAVLARSERLGRLDAMLENPDDIEFRRLYDFIGREVLADIERVPFEQLCVVAALETTNEDELAIALGSGTRATTWALRALPMVHEAHGRFTIHPLVAANLAREGGQLRRDILRRSCERLRGSGHVVRAITMAFSCGAPGWVADLFDDPAVRSNLPETIAGLLSRLDLKALSPFPGLWSAALTHRAAELPLDERLRHGLAMLRTLPEQTPAESVVAVADVLRECLIAQGEAAGLELVEQDVQAYLAGIGAAEHPTELRARTIARARLAAAAGAPVDVDLIRQTIGIDAPNALRAAVLAFIIAPACAMNGDRAAERQALNDAILHAKRAGVVPRLLECLQAAAIAAWIGHELGLYEIYLTALETLVRQHPQSARAAAHFLACARGKGLSARDDAESPAVRAMAWLIAAESAADAAERQFFFDEALRAADRSGQLRAKVLSRLAAAQTERRSEALLNEARRLVERSEDRALQDALATANGPLAGFARRFRGANRTEGAGSATLRVELLTGIVVRAGKPIALSPKEFVLLALLGIHARPVDGEILVDTLWPDATSKDRNVSLRVYVSRLRKRLGDAKAIHVTRQRYTHGEHVATDLDEIETFIRDLPTLSDTHAAIDRAIGYLRRLDAGPAGVLIDLPAFAVLYPRVNENFERLKAWLDERRVDLPNQLRIAIDCTLDRRYTGEERRRARRDRRVVG
jgi:hypothetical protein